MALDDIDHWQFPSEEPSFLEESPRELVQAIVQAVMDEATGVGNAYLPSEQALDDHESESSSYNCEDSIFRPNEDDVEYEINLINQKQEQDISVDSKGAASDMYRTSSEASDVDAQSGPDCQSDSPFPYLEPKVSDDLNFSSRKLFSLPNDPISAGIERSSTADHRCGYARQRIWGCLHGHWHAASAAGLHRRRRHGFSPFPTAASKYSLQDCHTGNRGG